jgi:hypothetical protein
LIAQDAVDCACGDPLGLLVAAGVAGSALYDAATNFYVWQKGEGQERFKLPAGLEWSQVVIAAFGRAVVVALAIVFFGWVAGAVTTRTAAGAVGVALPAALETFAGIRAKSVESNTGG